MTIQSRVKKLEKTNKSPLTVAYPIFRFDTDDGRVGDNCSQVRIRWASREPASDKWEMYYREPKETAQEFAERASAEFRAAQRHQLPDNLIILPDFGEYV